MRWYRYLKKSCKMLLLFLIVLILILFIYLIAFRSSTKPFINLCDNYLYLVNDNFNQISL